MTWAILVSSDFLSFSLCNFLEGQAAVHAMKNGYTYLQSLSFQQFISCDKKNFGCDGGALSYAVDYATKNGLMSLNDYPYTDGDGSTSKTCKVVENESELAVVAREGVWLDYNDRYDFEERLEIMKRILAEYGPVAMVVKSNCKLFSNYKKGILQDDQDCACDNPNCIDHAVLAVGYDDTANPPYIKIKNSWGTGWGE